MDRDLWLYAVCRKAPTMKYVNRGAVLIKAKQPFQDWANGLDSEGPQFDVSKQDGMVYLIKDELSPNQLDAHLRKIYKDIFEHELFAWHTVEDDWPKNRSYSKFKDWFDIQYTSEVADLNENDLCSEE